MNIKQLQQVHIMFAKYTLDLPLTTFTTLSTETYFESIMHGRQGAVLVSCDDACLVPIVRTTTTYNSPAQYFSRAHYDIVKQIAEKSGIVDLMFNNALIEIYNDSYCTMGYHTDQALDLCKDSYICLFSCYSDATTHHFRTLKVIDKSTAAQFDIPLENNLAVLFSTTTNAAHLHKIVLDAAAKANIQWLGITFRMSKTFIRFVDEMPFFAASGTQLTLMNEEQRTHFYKCKSAENKLVVYEYPMLEGTLSVSDMLKPVASDSHLCSY